VLVGVDGADAARDLADLCNSLPEVLRQSLGSSMHATDEDANGSSNGPDKDARFSPAIVLAGTGMQGAGHLVRVSLGIGQESAAAAALAECARNGNWVLLENVHLSMEWARGTLTRWIQAVEKAAAHTPLGSAIRIPRAVAAATIAGASTVSPFFRLFLSTEAVIEGSTRSIAEGVGMPVRLLASGSLVSYQQPAGAVPSVS